MRGFWVMGIAVWLAGCGYAQRDYAWDQAYLGAEKLLDGREFEAARGAFGELLESAHDPADKRLVRYRMAVLIEREGRTRAAIAEYEALWNTGQRDEISGHAIFRTGRLMYDKLDAPGHALRLWEQLLRALPETVAADSALQATLVHYERVGDDAKAIGLLDRLYRRLRDTRLADNLLFRRAAISRRRGELGAAISTYDRLIEMHPASGLIDNARWALADIYVGQGLLRKAMLQLRMLAEDRDTSWQIGLYDSELADDARFRRGVIALTMQGRPGLAEVEFETFLVENPESILRDDARWNIVQARLRRGDGRGANEACQELAEVEPESRWVDDCAELVAALNKGGKSTRLLGKVVTE
jgi:tetratricopeptide (TPR) repeat protein